jgi:superfamily II DNA or RNA helicase
MITLRPYQDRFVCQVHGALRECQRVVAVAPTGAGKGAVASWWAEKIIEKGRRLGVVTNRRVIVDQLARGCQRQGVRCGILMGNTDRDDEAPVQVCSIQTLQRRDWRDLPQVDWWIVDEAHRESAAYHKLFEHYPATKGVGLTATPVGAAGRSLIRDGLFERVVEPVTNTELLDAGYLLKTQVLAPSEPNVQGVNVLASGEYSQEDLGKRVQQCTVFADVFEWYRKYADRPAIVFAPRIVFARGLTEQFKEREIAAEMIEASTSTDERREIFDRVESGDVKVIVSVDVLKEGFDLPCAGLGIDLQPNKQFRTYWQKIGRIRRPYPGQEHAVWLDFAGNFWRFPHPDENPEWPDYTTDDTTQDVIQRQREQDDHKEPWTCPYCCMSLAPWQKVHGNVCPNCGQPLRKAVRRIRMENGKLRTVSAKEKKKRQTDERVSAWFGCLYPVLYSGLKLDMARVSYKKRMGTWPDPAHLPYCPDHDSPDWKRKAIKLYPNLDKRKAKT